MDTGIPPRLKAEFLARALSAAFDPPKVYLTRTVALEIMRRIEASSWSALEATPLTPEQRTALEADCREDLADEDLDPDKRAESIMILCALTLTTGGRGGREPVGAASGS